MKKQAAIIKLIENFKRLGFKEFMKQWGEGVSNATPLQQTKIALWSFIPIFAGLIWGIVVTLVGGIYWMSLILIGSLPITGTQFISNMQKYKSLKEVERLMKDAR